MIPNQDVLPGTKPLSYGQIWSFAQMMARATAPPCTTPARPSRSRGRPWARSASWTANTDDIDADAARRFAARVDDPRESHQERVREVRGRGKGAGGTGRTKCTSPEERATRPRTDRLHYIEKTKSRVNEPRNLSTPLTREAGVLHLGSQYLTGRPTPSLNRDDGHFRDARARHGGPPRLRALVGGGVEGRASPPPDPRAMGCGASKDARRRTRPRSPERKARANLTMDWTPSARARRRPRR